MNHRTIHLTAWAVAVFIADRKVTPEEIEEYFGFSRRKLQRVITLLRKAGLRTYTRPTTYELTQEMMPAIAMNDGRPLAEVKTTASTRSIGSPQPYYRTYRQKHKSENYHGGSHA